MAYQAVFKRYELKYILETEQAKRLIDVMKPYMAPDKYGHTVIKNIYFDTESYRLIRRSIEKPSYKEKLRIRSYGTITEKSEVFVELKKKCNSVVYKRRIAMCCRKATDWLVEKKPCTVQSQISDEIEYFTKYYGDLSPAVLLSYERDAFYSNDGSDLRITLDRNILCRDENITLTEEPYGTLLLPKDKTLVEIKCSAGIPLWLTGFLSAEHIYKTSFSKYGTAYCTLIYPKPTQEATKHA